MGLADRVLDNGLTVLDTEVTKLCITAGEATTYSEATTSGNKMLATYALASGASSPADASPNGRYVTVPVVPGSGSAPAAAGTATHWALVDENNTRLLATGALSASVALATGNSGFILNAFNITIPASA